MTLRNVGSKTNVKAHPRHCAYPVSIKIDIPTAEHRVSKDNRIQRVSCKRQRGDIGVVDIGVVFGVQQVFSIGVKRKNTCGTKLHILKDAALKCH